MTTQQILPEWTGSFRPVVPFDPSKDRLFPFDFTAANGDLSPEKIADTDAFARYISSTLLVSHCRYGFGGYGEHRTIYARSTHFDGKEDGFEEPRRLHLGIDIWGPAGTMVMAPLDGIVHSFAFNNHDGDYGATLILTHAVGAGTFHTLYGHLSLNSLKNLVGGTGVRAGEVIGEFGMRFENGGWPPHLHFQLIRDMQGLEGDYPGVCRFSERARWMENCPDPDLILQMGRYIKGQGNA
ncbi:MAG: peptidoglycan DD-metalloendopeptidase family protein [Puia sp.]|nr:peptidoglycan DD-metalloendopeptidase family protein [Puia sp.]